MNMRKMLKKIKNGFRWGMTFLLALCFTSLWFVLSTGAIFELKIRVLAFIISRKFIALLNMLFMMFVTGVLLCFFIAGIRGIINMIRGKEKFD